MDWLISLIIWIVLGAFAGWVASKLMKGHSLGFVKNAVLGIIGSLVGGWVFGLIGFSARNGIGSFIAAVVGAMIVIAIANAINRR